MVHHQGVHCCSITPFLKQYFDRLHMWKCSGILLCRTNIHGTLVLPQIHAHAPPINGYVLCNYRSVLPGFWFIS